MSLTGKISNIARGSLHDGEGVRTVVYFKGCGMKCKWCHNPETLSAASTVLYAPAKCICCGRCIEICPECHKAGNDSMLFERGKCKSCGKCAEVCPTGALSLCGETMSTDEVLHEVEKDAHYYLESGGGVTLSGGECLLQADFAAELLQKCKNSGINTAIESAFFVPFDNIEKVLGVTDLIFADLKHHDSTLHQKYTGQPNKQILQNIGKASHLHKNIIIRIPLIPGVNDSEDDMRGFGKIINRFGDGINAIELLKYNYLAESKYKSSGHEYHSFGREAQSDEKLKSLAGILEGITGKKIII